MKLVNLNHVASKQYYHQWRLVALVLSHGGNKFLLDRLVAKEAALSVYGIVLCTAKQAIVTANERMALS